MIKRIALVVVAAVLLLAAAVALNTARHGSQQVQVPPAPPLALDDRVVAEKLAGALRFRTVSSYTDPQANIEEFRKLQAYLQERFPKLHSTLQRETVGGMALLYTWKGADPSAKPIAMMAHQDVVPIEPGTEGNWKVQPFAGEIRDGYIWGRGSWDDKGNLVAMMQAIELLLEQGFQPRQTVYLVSTADEELMGGGAKAIAGLLQQRGVKLDFVIDEGLFLAQGLIPGVAKPTALIGVAEKGFISVLLKAKGVPGHASAPPPPGQTAISKLSLALRRLDEQQMPARLEGVAREMFETLAPEMNGFQRVALSNLWLFGPLVHKQLENGAATNAMLRTTTSLTVVSAGNKDNVIPGQAEATVNFRILPGETRETVMQHVRDVVGPDMELSSIPNASDPTGVSPTSAPAYQTVARTVRSVFPEAVVTPALYVAGSDSHYFTGLTDNIYRFCPVRVKPEDVHRIHGTDERLSVANLGELVHFYHQLLRNLNAPAP